MTFQRYIFDKFTAYLEQEFDKKWSLTTTNYMYDNWQYWLVLDVGAALPEHDAGDDDLYDGVAALALLALLLGDAPGLDVHASDHLVRCVLQAGGYWGTEALRRSGVAEVWLMS